MNKAILGTKVGMTQIFDENGIAIPVTVIAAAPNVIIRKKTVATDGYTAVVVAVEDVKESALNKPELGVYKKLNVAPKRYLKEFRFDDDSAYEVGSSITCEVFAEGDMVDITGTSKGHGFTGKIKRWNQRRLKMTHGTGPVHRGGGSTGANSDPSRKLPGLKSAGQYGAETVTVQNLKIVKVDAARGALLVRGAVPGPNGGKVTVVNTVKAVRAAK